VLVLVYWAAGAAPALITVPLGLLGLLNIRPLRLAVITRPFLNKYRRLLPSMSATEREAAAP
jgi:hypothetical protein